MIIQLAILALCVFGIRGLAHDMALWSTKTREWRPSRQLLFWLGCLLVFLLAAVIIGVQIGRVIVAGVP